MGFSIEAFFEELNEILAKDQKAAKTLKELKSFVAWEENYACQCGIIKTKESE